MKVCFLTDDPADIGGGPEHIRNVSRILQERYGLDVDVVTPLLMDPGFNIRDLWRRMKFAFWVLIFLLTSDYDIYHSHSFSTSAFLPVVRVFGKKAAITVHGTGESLTAGGILNQTFIPRFLRWVILNVWPFDFRLSAGRLRNFTFVGNGVDTEEFSKVRRRKHRGFTILCIARRDPVKGVEILEGAIKRVQERYPEVRLNLVSGRRRTLADFATADLFVLPSLSEGLPITLLEAMAARLPVVVTDVGDCRRLVEKSRCGVIVPVGNVGAIARAIAQMAAKRDLRKLGENGCNYVCRHYSWDLVARRTFRLYRQKRV